MRRISSKNYRRGDADITNTTLESFQDKETEEDDAVRSIDIDNDVTLFLNRYFSDTVNKIEFEESFILENNLKSVNVDYFRLRRFLTTALRNFKDIDDGFISGLLLKLQKDVFSLFDFYQKILSDTKLNEPVFQQFLLSLHKYVELKKEIDKLKPAKDSLESQFTKLEEAIKTLSEKKKLSDNEKQMLKKCKDQYADAVHSYANIRDRVAFLEEKIYKLNVLYKSSFISKFTSAKQEYLKRLEKTINTKAYHLDKYMWSKAEQNKRIVEFMQNANISGDYDMKTFIQYYLRNINIEDSADKEWHSYLAKAMKILD